MSRKPLAYVDVEKLFYNAGFILQDTSYINNNTPMQCMCNKCNVVSYIRLRSITTGHGCRSCANKNQTYTLEQVKTIFNKTGCKLLSTSYKNSYSKLDYICNCGTTSSITLGNFSSGKRCMVCSSNARSVVMSNYLVSTNEQILTATARQYTFKCLCGKIETRLTDFRLHKEDRKIFCNECKLNKRNQYKGRLTQEYTDWRNNVFELDNYTCVRCDSGGVLNAHHIVPWNINKSLRLDISNGVTLCESCHKEFHSIFGYTDSSVRFKTFMEVENAR